MSIDWKNTLFEVERFGKLLTVRYDELDRDEPIYARPLGLPTPPDLDCKECGCKDWRIWLPHCPPGMFALLQARCARCNQQWGS